MNINKLFGPLYALAIITAFVLILVMWVAISIDAKPRCESAYITISAAEVCHQSPACKLTVADVEKYLKARRVHGECLREGVHD